MSRIKSAIFPDIPDELSARLFCEEKEVVVIGVIGRSNDAECNKMAGFDMVNINPNPNASLKNGQIRVYYNELNPKILYLHFQTPFDEMIMEQMLFDRMAELESKQPVDADNLNNGDDLKSNGDVQSFHTFARTKFAQILIFAIHVCHVIVLVETNSVFDTSYLSIFKAIKVIREKYVLKFLPKYLKSPNFGSAIGREGRLCSPRFLFYFEQAMHKYKSNDALHKYEFEIEDGIYKMLRNELIITNSSMNSLFSIPRNKRFVCVNTDSGIRTDPLTESINRLAYFIGQKEKSKFNGDCNDQSDSDDEIRPFNGFAKPLNRYKTIDETFSNKNNSNRLLQLIDEHVEEALQNGFDDSIAKYKGKNHFVIPSSKQWYEMFKRLHKIFIENPENKDFEPNDPDYKAYLDNFNRIIDIDDRYFTECCEYGLELAIEHYKEMLPHFYSKEYHEQKVIQSNAVLSKYGRGKSLSLGIQKLSATCEEIWLNGRQQCEFKSLRGNPCVMPMHETTGNETIHNSGETIVSTCNCGRTQGIRVDPYLLRQANYEFYRIMMTNCTACPKLEAVTFPVFEPSSNEYRAADVEKPETGTQKKEGHATGDDDEYYHLSQPSQLANLELSMGSALLLSESEDNNRLENNRDDNEKLSSDHNLSTPTDDEANGSDSMNEIVVCVGGEDNEEPSEKGIHRQPSTTEYLSGMIHNMSPAGLLPQFPSWSLVCVGHSSIYSHSSGLPEHVQSGFLSGANFLLPWDVQVRLENAASWSRNIDRSRNRRKPQSTAKDSSDNKVFVLKIFVGYEYECARGHRFFMSDPKTILRGGSGINKDAGSKVVFNDMPLYFACPCRNTKPLIAQLMRVHIVTPKAPVNIIVEPKVRTGEKCAYVFETGCTEPLKLGQSSYWMLRLPYVYESIEGPIRPPCEVTLSNYMSFGCLVAGMFGVVETKEKAN